MSYCRFQNTLNDLIDCYDNIENDDLSEDEEIAKKRLIKICRNYTRFRMSNRLV
jgi:hypothetical protein